MSSILKHLRQIFIQINITLVDFIRSSSRRIFWIENDQRVHLLFRLCLYDFCRALLQEKGEAHQDATGAPTRISQVSKVGNLIYSGYVPLSWGFRIMSIISCILQHSYLGCSVECKRKEYLFGRNTTRSAFEMIF